MDHSQHSGPTSATSSLSVSERVNDFFSQYGFMPHGHCYLWKPWLVGLHVVSDFLIGMAYLSISFTLYWLVKKINLKFNRIVLSFGVFIGACGLTHFMEIWNLWSADYWWAAWVKVITAIASVFTGLYLYKLRGPIVQVSETAKLLEQHKLRLEALLAERTEDFNMIANSIPQMVWKADQSGFVTWYNQRWYDFTGTTLEEMQGWGWQKIHHPDHEQRVTESWKMHLEAGKDWEDTFPLKKHNGEWRWFLTRARATKDKNGKILNWFGTNTDVTDELRVKEELRETDTKLRTALTVRDEFLLVASHELKTPLTALHLNTQLFERLIVRNNQGAFDPGRISGYVNQTLRQLNRLNRLVDDMLDISRIETGRLTIKKETTDLAELIKELKVRLDELFIAQTGKEIKLSVEGSHVGDWDRTRIEQVLSNLLTNAIRYGGKKPIEMTLTRSGTTAEVRVIDHGVGVPKDMREKVFERFERGIVSANDVSGLGLGLYIARQIVLSHGGEIRNEETPGGGSTFIVSLPDSLES